MVLIEQALKNYKVLGKSVEQGGDIGQRLYSYIRNKGSNEDFLSLLSTFGVWLIIVD